MIARRVLCLLLGCAAVNAGAQSFITMGRLFTTPSERAQLDQARSSGAAVGPDGRSVSGGFSGGGGGAGGSGAWTAGAVGSAGAIAPMAGGGAGGGQSGAGALATDGGAAAAPTAPEPVRLTGMIRRSNGRTTVFVNNEEQPARPTGQGKSARVPVDGGRTVILKPGQSYDPATGEIRETGR